MTKFKKVIKTPLGYDKYPAPGGSFGAPDSGHAKGRLKSLSEKLSDAPQKAAGADGRSFPAAVDI
ncbi:hypothetical protein [Synergistes jonesii]|uniref:hypothetical protein n=1 Tax=Synergistes jonesii TaxID=2754 RepID=UPI00248E9BD4|nr:hypothetical protein [Synergistes jonesii]